MKYKVTTPGSTLNVRYQGGERIGSLPNGYVFDGTLQGDKIHLDATVAAAYCKPVDDVPPSPSTGFPLGVHLLFNAADAAQNAGCRAFTVMNNQDLANRLATTDPTKWSPQSTGNFVMYRQHHAANPWSPPDMVAQLGGMLDWHNPNVVLTLANEWDNGIPGAGTTYEGMVKFCDWTLQCMDLLAARGFSNVAVMTASTGTPDFTNDGVCQAIREKLAPHWNSGRIRFIDLHNYSPTMDHIYKDGQLVWYERRWEWLYTKCGFDPKAPGRIVSSETGVDEGSIGGFPAHSASGADVVRWCRRFVEIQSRPLVVDGVSYPSPYLVGTLFQQGDASTAKGHWGGYDVTPYLNDLKACQWGQA